jgi:hypothetical protein
METNMQIFILLISSATGLSILNVFDSIEKAEQEKQVILQEKKFTDSEVNILEYTLK